VISEQHAVILVHSTSHAIRAEKVLQEAGIRTKLIPIPRHLSSSCGVCVRVVQADRGAARQALEAVGLEIDAVHDL
jgi:hypothetical protein